MILYYGSIAHGYSILCPYAVDALHTRRLTTLPLGGGCPPACVCAGRPTPRGREHRGGGLKSNSARPDFGFVETSLEESKGAFEAFRLYIILNIGTGTHWQAGCPRAHSLVAWSTKLRARTRARLSAHTARELERVQLCRHRDEAQSHAACGREPNTAGPAHPLPHIVAH